MKVLLTTGCPNSGYQEVFDALCQAGVVNALPARKTGHSARDLQTSILRSHKVDLQQNTALKQLHPGQRWREPASDLFLANAESAVWGWADDQTAPLMDFWQEFGPQVGVLLVYCAPAEHLIKEFQQHPDRASADVEACLRQWHDWNNALLRYHLRHPERTLLVSATTALAQAESLHALLQETWGIEGLRKLSTASAPDEIDAALGASAKFVVAANHYIGMLEQQLNDCAQMPDAQDGGGSADPLALWTATCDMVAKRQAHVEQGEALHGEIKLVREQLEQAQRESAQHVLQQQQSTLRCDLLQERLGEVQSELQVQVQRDQAKRHSAETEAPSAQLDELRQENELTRLQLEQVQEELAYYFQKNQELQSSNQARANGFLADFWRTHQPDVLMLDLRRPIAGDQWYDAEPDGRWTGPATSSTLDLPPLQAGTYLLELDVMDAMSLDILNDAQIELQGHSHRFTVDFLADDNAFPAICSTSLTVRGGAEESLQLALRLTRNVSPADTGGRDDRRLGLRVQQVRLIRQRSGADDLLVGS